MSVPGNDDDEDFYHETAKLRPAGGRRARGKPEHQADESLEEGSDGPAAESEGSPK